MLRAEPVPMGLVLLTARIWPNEGDERFTVGLPNSVRLRTLKASIRSDTLVFSVILMLLAIAVSIWNRPGARTSALPALPQDPFAGIKKAAGLIHALTACPPAGVSDTSGTTFGRCPAVIAVQHVGGLAGHLDRQGQPRTDGADAAEDPVAQQSEMAERQRIAD